MLPKINPGLRTPKPGLCGQDKSTGAPRCHLAKSQWVRTWERNGEGAMSVHQQDGPRGKGCFPKQTKEAQSLPFAAALDPADTERVEVLQKVPDFVLHGGV